MVNHVLGVFGHAEQRAAVSFGMHDPPGELFGVKGFKNGYPYCNFGLMAGIFKINAIKILLHYKHNIPPTFSFFPGRNQKPRKYPVFKCDRKTLSTMFMGFSAMLNNVVKSVLRWMTPRVSYTGSKFLKTGIPTAILDLWQNVVK